MRSQAEPSNERLRRENWDSRCEQFIRGGPPSLLLFQSLHDVLGHFEVALGDGLRLSDHLS